MQTTIESRVLRTCALLAACVSLVAVSAQAGPVITIDFETEDDFFPGPATPLVNGQSISSPEEFGNFVNISGAGNNLGPAIFDATPGGPNDGGVDDDLVVAGLGNVLILQSNNSPGMTGDIFDTPNDAAGNGPHTLIFDFLSATELFSIDLVDIDGGASTTVTLSDTLGRERVYFVPNHWTGDTAFETLDLLLTTPQPGPGPGGFAVVMSEAAGYDPTSVASLQVSFSGSAAMDNLRFVPEPSTAILLGCGLLAIGRRRR